MAAPEASTMDATIAQISGIGEVDCQDSGEEGPLQAPPLSPMGISAPADVRMPGETPDIVWCTHSLQPEDKVLGLRAKHPQRRIPVLFFLGRHEVGTTAYTEEEMREWTLEVIQGDPPTYLSGFGTRTRVSQGICHGDVLRHINGPTNEREDVVMDALEEVCFSG